MDLRNLSLREKVFQCMIMKPKMMKRDLTLEEYFEKYPVGGLYFAKGPVQDLAEMEPGEASTSNAFIAKCRKAAKYPLLVCADGANIGDDGMPAVSKNAMASSPNAKQLAYDYGKSEGMQMNANDVDWILGPCLDLAIYRHCNTISGTMSDDAEYTAELGVEIIRGIQEQNVAATIKHFPGVGTHHINAHDAPSQNVMDMDTWMDTYGRVYKAAFDAGVMCLMTTHMSLDSYSTSVDYPGFGYPIATYNKDINLGLIKGELGFQGVIVTDAMTMGGCGTEDGIEDSVAAFACGADLILWPEEEVGDRIVEEIKKGNIPMSRLDDAIERIQRLRERLGMDKGERVKAEVDSAFVDHTMKTILQEGITVLRNEIGNLPLDPSRKKVLVVPVVIKEKPEEKERALRCGEIFGEILKEAGFDVRVTERAKAWDQLNARKIQAPFDYLIHLYDIPFPLNMGGSWSTQLMPMAKKVGISFSAPYLFDDYFFREKTYVQMNSGLNEYSAKAAAYAVLGKTEMVGKMAIKVRGVMD